MVQAVWVTASKTKDNQAGWFHKSLDTLMSLVKACNNALACSHLLKWANIINRTNSLSDALGEEYINTKRNLQEACSLAQTQWSKCLTQQVEKMPHSPYMAWENIQTLKYGLTGHHQMFNPMRMRLPSGSLATNDAKNASLFLLYFHRFFNRNPKIN